MLQPSSSQRLRSSQGSDRKKSAPYCNITYISGDEENSTFGYLQALYDQNPASVGGELPDDGFYYVK